jgi:integrase
MNRIDEAVTVATLPAYKPVVEGEMLATVKIIPFAVAGDIFLDRIYWASQSGYPEGLDFITHSWFRLDGGPTPKTSLQGARINVLTTKVERYREKAPEISFLTLAQIDEQLAALKDHPQLQTMVAMYIYAGLRREEALWLTVDDVDLSAGGNGMIRVRAKTVNGDFWQPKTGVNRIVPISRSLRGYLDRYEPKAVKGGWYFSSPKGLRWNPDNFSEWLREANQQIKPSWSCLDYRHTFGSLLAIKGESLYKISKLLGNSPDICRRHYAALLPESMMSCVDF